MPSLPGRSPRPARRTRAATCRAPATARGAAPRPGSGGLLDGGRPPGRIRRDLVYLVTARLDPTRQPPVCGDFGSRIDPARGIALVIAQVSQSKSIIEIYPTNGRGARGSEAAAGPAPARASARSDVRVPQRQAIRGQVVAGPLRTKLPVLVP